MARKDHPEALTLERFASGKDGQANAFKKKKQANKRKLFEKAQLKRQYAKLLKKEAQAADESRHGQTGDGEPSQQAHTAEDAGPGGGFVFQPHAMAGAGERKIGVRAIDTKELEGGHDEIRPKKRGGGHEAGDEQAGGSRSQEKQKRKRQGHRPDPFHEAKAKADQKRREAKERQNDRERQHQEKEGRVKKRKKQHALLSKRTRVGQPVMKHTMQHLLEKIKAQS